jgi:hypothetical protein
LPGFTAIGGAIYSTGGALSIAGGRIANNQATGGGGGDAACIIGYPPFRGTDGGWAIGAGLYATGASLDIAGTTIASNRVAAGAGGAGLYHPSCGTIFGGNNGTAQGAGLYIGGGSLTISTSNIAANGSWPDYPYNGGGIYNSGTLTVSNSTLSGNIGYYGGGIYNLGTLTVSNSSLSGNTAYFGGGISTNAGTVSLTNVTLTANRAYTAYTSGGGLYVTATPPVLHNTLIAGNLWGVGTTHSDVSGALNPSGDYNLIGDGTGMTGLSDGVNGNQVGSAAAPIDPLLGPLDDNGGPTLTHALLSGSPAIDAGNNDYATDWDQRGDGFPRIVGIIDPDNPVIDIGAFEVQGGGSGPSRHSRQAVTPLRLDVAALLDTPPSQPVSGMRSENKHDMAVLDTLFSNHSAAQSVLLVGRPEVGDAPTFVHRHKESRLDLTQADAFGLFGVFLAD